MMTTTVHVTARALAVATLTTFGACSSPDSASSTVAGLGSGLRQLTPAERGQVVVDSATLATVRALTVKNFPHLGTGSNGQPANLLYVVNRDGSLAAARMAAATPAENAAIARALPGNAAGTMVLQQYTFPAGDIAPVKATVTWVRVQEPSAEPGLAQLRDLQVPYEAEVADRDAIRAALVGKYGREFRTASGKTRVYQIVEGQNGLELSNLTAPVEAASRIVSVSFGAGELGPDPVRAVLVTP